MDDMEDAAPHPSISGVARKVSKILRSRRRGAGDAPTSDDGCSVDRSKLSAEFYSPDAEKAAALRAAHEAAAEALLANLFAGVSAVKAAYAQLQLAQSPYDPEAIQSSDAAVVAELTRLSELKRRFYKNPLGLLEMPSAPPLAAQAEELRHLLRTYQITARKLETEIRAKSVEAEELRSRLSAAERDTRVLEDRLHPGRTLAGLNELHLSGLNPTHFLTALRFAVKSIRSFAKSMAESMHSVGWDVAAAAAAIHPRAPIGSEPRDRRFAFESYVSMKMFANFHLRDFNLSFLDERNFYDRKSFFDEFAELKPEAALREVLNGRNPRWAPLGKFFRAKYLSLVHARMETAFFGRHEQRGIVSAGPGFPESTWFQDFAEMARRVWLLHCLFFAFDGAEQSSIFQARRGERFSEAYMENVAAEDDEKSSAAVGAAGTNTTERTVGFSVVPGFRVGRTVIQCRVYLNPSRREP